MASPESSTRTPIQNRSKDRVKAILQAAKELILEKGSAQVQIQEIAKRAGISISSMYQYFPDKSAIIQEIFKQYLETIREIVRGTSLRYDSIEDLSRSLGVLYDRYYEFYCREPVLRDIIAIGEADKQFQHRSFEDSVENALFIYNASKHLFPVAKHEEFQRFMLMVVHLTDKMMHLTMFLDKNNLQEADTMNTTIKRLVSPQLLELLLHE
jgi:AcrR family transcriptional regulator